MGFGIKTSEIYVFKPFKQCDFVTRDTLFWRKNCILFVSCYNLRDKNMHDCWYAIVHAKRIILIYKT